MRNIQGDGAAEDLIRSIQQLICAEGHAKTLLEKFQAELENDIIDTSDDDVVQAQVEKINDTLEEISSLAELRRSMMLYLFNMYSGDKREWCSVKHLASAAYCAFEAYQASEDPALLDMAMEANKRFIKALTRFLGVEITECAACFADSLRSEPRKEMTDGSVY